MSGKLTGLPEPGRVVGGKYHLDALLGAGGMGAVYAATHQITGKRVAVKWMLPALSADARAATRFIREARIAAQAEHPNVVNVFDVGRDDDGSLFLVMELLRGRPLSERIEAQEGMEIVELVDVMLTTMRGVHHAHEAGAIHRDLKPDNIFITENGQGKVLDFGVGVLQTEEPGVALTRTGMIVGTPLYMSPEQITASKNIDARSDVYALGVILYEGLTGHVPFDADSYTALAVRIMTDTPTPPRSIRPELPEELERVVIRALARQPDDRYASVRELGRALEPFGSGVRFDVPTVGSAPKHAPEPATKKARTDIATLPTEAAPAPLAAPTPVPEPEPASRASARRYVPALALVALVVVLSSVAVVWANRRDGEDAATASPPGDLEPANIVAADPGPTAAVGERLEPPPSPSEAEAEADIQAEVEAAASEPPPRGATRRRPRPAASTETPEPRRVGVPTVREEEF